MKRMILVLLASLIFLLPGCAEAPEIPQPPAAPVEKVAEAPPPEIAPEAPAAPAAEPTYENWTTPIPKTKPKKGKAKIWILSVVGALLVAAIVCGIVFWPNISGFFSNQYNKLFNKEEYLEKMIL